MEKFLTLPPAVIAAIVAAITSLATLLLTLLTKNFIEKRLLIFKLDTEHKFDQRKKIKTVLAANKSHLLNACENLNHRLWNFGKPDHFKWLDVKSSYITPNYYFHSTIYRILAVYAWMQKIQTELIHLDTTIASKEDLEFIKFIRFYGRIFSDTDFFKDLDYDYNYQTDHIFKNNIDELYQCVVNNERIITYNEFTGNLGTLHRQGNLLPFYKLLDGVNDFENRLRWQWFPILKLLNIAFLNAYGYDYQQTSDEKLLKAIRNPKAKLYGSFIFLLTEHKLEGQKEIKRLIKLLKKAYPDLNIKAGTN